MTQPRRILPGTTYLITRRTLRRHFLFRPDPDIRRLFLYALCVNAKRFHIDVHAVVLMSTHEHLIVTDPEGNLPLFLRSFHRQVALGTKVLRKWEGPVWDQQKTSEVRLLTPRAIFENLAYVMANPVKAGLVRYAKDWPGVNVRPQDLGQLVLRAKRPEGYYDVDNPQWPDSVELQLTLPPALTKSYARQAIVTTVADELRKQERNARRDLKAQKWSVMGAKRVKKCSPFRRAKSFEKLVSRNPTFAVGRRQKKRFFKAVEELRAFRTSYRDALTEWKRGKRDVTFPLGSWLMPELHRAHVIDSG